MTHREALAVLAAGGGQHLVFTTHGSVDLGVTLSDTPRDDVEGESDLPIDSPNQPVTMNAIILPD
jgi:hypothetical protein